MHKRRERRTIYGAELRAREREMVRVRTCAWLTTQTRRGRHHYHYCTRWGAPFPPLHATFRSCLSHARLFSLSHRSREKNRETTKGRLEWCRALPSLLVLSSQSCSLAPGRFRYPSSPSITQQHTTVHRHTGTCALGWHSPLTLDSAAKPPLRRSRGSMVLGLASRSHPRTQHNIESRAERNSRTGIHRMSASCTRHGLLRRLWDVLVVARDDAVVTLEGL